MFFFQRGLYEKLARRKNRLNLERSNNRSASTSADDTAPVTTPADAKAAMKRDFQAGVTNTAAYRDNMNATRELRTQEAKQKPGLLLLREYPALTLTDVVRYSQLNTFSMAYLPSLIPSAKVMILKYMVPIFLDRNL